MSVFPPDQRQIIQPSDPEFTDFPFSAVTAIDAQIGAILQYFPSIRLSLEMVMMISLALTAKNEF